MGTLQIVLSVLALAGLVSAVAIELRRSRREGQELKELAARWSTN